MESNSFVIVFLTSSSGRKISDAQSITPSLWFHPQKYLLGLGGDLLSSLASLTDHFVLHSSNLLKQPWIREYLHKHQDEIPGGNQIPKPKESFFK